jgi:DNA-binding transcriptional MerR regulator
VRIRFIKRAQDLGFSLKEIERKLQDLKRMKASLKRLMSVCVAAEESKTGRAACDCRVAECFEKGGCL